MEPLALIGEQTVLTKVVQDSNLAFGFLHFNLKLDVCLCPVAVLIAKFPRVKQMVPNQFDVTSEPGGSVVVLGDFDIVRDEVLVLEKAPLSSPATIKKLDPPNGSLLLEELSVWCWSV